ncbi:carboxypeptidase regulatory-like domain-containing protein [Asticcacaulis sp. EMRT-3]|uniref:TonB-dependent receptor n=1 Tax=Asticcacaulis sp. EMRT-3 TaxID=3040349 RepID=UPI0024AEFC2B|nr:carboxypeptidase regulatory-like domain-containing protein [Asticcacaulis sp. EMRT-3]MDI7775835.1 carboxypeptidase regulatory-like domain-containing protein [Asticcacaulis sp. EMRT-3]
MFKIAAAASVLALISASTVYAQQTTGGLKGYVTDASGKAVAGARVTIVHTPTGMTSTATTDSTGYYAIDQLRVGGPYTVSVSTDSEAVTKVTVPVVGIGEATEADVALQSSSAPTEVTVRGVRASRVAGRTHIGAAEIAAEPTLERDIRDYALKSPTAWEDSTNSGALSLGGQNSRSNAILIDGVKEGDDFGLNANGLPTLRSPISVDTLEAVNVDTAPYDVQYDFFQGGVINFVTKSGGNDFHGGLVYEETNNNMRGKKLDYKNSSGNWATKTVTGDFSEKTYGAHLSGPIVKDKLFFFVDYEKFEGSLPATYGPAGSGAGNIIKGVSQADIDQVTSIMKSKYGYDPLGWSGSEPYTDEKYFGKLDWQINDNQRATLSYQDTKSQSISDYDNSTSYGDLALQSHWYTNETDLKVYKLQVLSNWTDAFSTEFNASKKEVSAIPVSMGGTDFAEFRIVTPEGGYIYLGPDRYRHYNILTNNNTHFDFKGKYRLDKHTLFFGVEHEKVDIFNAFVAYSNGVYTFNKNGSSGTAKYASGIDALAAGDANSVSYDNSYDNVKADGAASFSYSTNSAYIQDTWRVTPRFTLAYGLRYDSYSSNQQPKANPTFLANYGFSNTKGLDGLSSLQPRVSFTWHPAIDDTLTVYGGIGKFQGGQANVWISDSYSNTGNLLGYANCYAGSAKTPTTPDCLAALTNVGGTDVGTYLQSVNAANAGAGTGTTNAIAPDFKIPSVWKASLGFAKTFDMGSLGDNYHFSMEYDATKFDAATYWYDIYQEQFYSGSAPDGRPEFFNTTAKGIARANRQDVVLDTVGLGKADQLIVTLSKAWHAGWANGLSLDLSAVSSNSTDVNSGTSSIATSNMKSLSTSDYANPVASNSNYMIDRMAKLTVSYQHKFFGDNVTGIYLYNQYRTGQHYSFTFDDTSSSANNGTGLYGQNATYTGYDTELLYVPASDSSGNVTANSDARVHYKAGFDVSGFNQFLHDTGLIKYAGSIAPRNAFKSPATFLTNLRITQELPAISSRWGKFQLYLDVQNLGNLINPKWGTVAQYSYPYNYGAVVATNCQAAAATSVGNGNPPKNVDNSCAASGNYYQYNSYQTKSPTYYTSGLYQVKVGVTYKF